MKVKSSMHFVSNLLCNYFQDLKFYTILRISRQVILLLHTVVVTKYILEISSMPHPD